MLKNLNAYLAAQHAPLKAALTELVRIPSVCAEGEGGYPFGSAVDQALRKALEIASELGFRTRYGDGSYYGYAEVGEGQEMLGILGHLDLAPPGKLEDWEHDPFDPVENNGKIYGRGTQDDKGPLLAGLFAVKALMDAGVNFNKRVRFIFGTDEETLWRCINRYKEIYIPLDHPLIETLIRVYRELTGDALTEPRASGGATYARAIDNCVAYGALTYYEELTAHQPNERAVLQNLYNATEIYAHAVCELTR
jgi:acetylornithine deacetylase/succinyl-diaminopimelate desuccinylase-like protein